MHSCLLEFVKNLLYKLKAVPQADFAREEMSFGYLKYFYYRPVSSAVCLTLTSRVHKHHTHKQVEKETMAKLH